MKKNKSVSGGILLEVLFMLSIMIGIFPIIQGNVKKRTDEIRNKMVVNDLLKIKEAVENYLKRNIEVAGDNGTVANLEMEKLYDVGLSQTFVSDKENILGQKYEIKVKKDVNPSTGSVSYSAVIIAKDPSVSIPTMRIRDIIKETKGYGGYLEKEGDNYTIYGQNWQLNGNNWGMNVFYDEYKNSVFVRAGLAKKEYEYIARKSGKNIMKTDLRMNNQNIDLIRSLYIGDSLDAGELNLNTESNGTAQFGRIAISGYDADDDSVSDANKGRASFIISAAMKIKGALKFPIGLTMSSLKFEDDKTLYVKLQQRLQTLNLQLDNDENCNFSSLYSGNCNRARRILANILKPKDAYMQIAVANLLKVGGLLNVNNVTTSSFDHSSSLLKNVKFEKVYDSSVEKINHKEITLNDIILRKVNKKLENKTVGGITISEKTPLSVVFRALYYEYADFYKAMSDVYPTSNRFGLKWCYKIKKRYLSPDNNQNNTWFFTGSDNCKDNVPD